MEDKGAFEAFDLGYYGSYVKNRRKKMGYKSAKDFCATLWRRTRIKLSTDALYDIERGEREPTITQFIAINLVISGCLVDMDRLNDWVCNEWGGPVSHGEIPFEWKIENFDAAADELNLDKSNATVRLVALRTHDDEYLFAIDFPF